MFLGQKWLCIKMTWTTIKLVDLNLVLFHFRMFGAFKANGNDGGLSQDQKHLKAKTLQLHQRTIIIIMLEY